jgi:predicted nucleic acid-binding protein
MIVCLDANIVIYLVERNPIWEPRAAARVQAARAAGDRIAVSDAARLECLVGAILSPNPALPGQYAAYFADPGIEMLPVTVAVWERAASVRAVHGFQALDAIHLATAVEHGCGLFLTNDARLARFADVPVEVLT